MKKKAKIEIEIDCNEKTCGKCKRLRNNYSAFRCSLFLEWLDTIKQEWIFDKPLRCAECINKFGS